MRLNELTVGSPTWVAPKAKRTESTAATTAPLTGSHDRSPSKFAPVASQTAAYP